MIYLSFFPDYKNHINVNGNAITSEKLYLRYFKKKKDVLLNTTSSNKLNTPSSNQYLTKIKKTTYSLYALFLLISQKQKSIYTVLLDNIGFNPHIILLFIASFFCKKIIIYHHSFKYIRKKRFLLSLLKFKNIIHVATSKKQFLILKKVYGLKNSQLIGNFIFLLDEKVNFKKKFKKNFRVIFFSSIMQRKGIFDFIALSKKFVKNTNINFYIYGNDCSDDMLKTLKNLKKQKIISNYKLNIYGKIKKQIFKNNDILIFPSKHDSETTPLVLDECINYGIVPIAYNIGDTKSQIGQLGLVVNSFQHLNQKLLNTISNYNKVKKKLIEYKKSKLLKKEILLKKLDVIFKT